MKSVSVKNYRSIIDSGEIEIKPITILVGKNSAGKSSFIRLFPLLKQTLEKKVDKSLLWYGDYVDFGDFETTISKGHKKDDEIELSFSFPMYNRYYRLIGRAKGFNPIDTKLSFKINDTNISEYKIEFGDQTIVMKIGDDGAASFIINGVELKRKGKYYAQRFSGDIVPMVFQEVENKRRRVLSFYDDILSEDSDFFITGTKSRHFSAFNINLSDISTKNFVLEFIKSTRKKKYENLKVSDAEFIEMNNTILFSSLSNIIESLNESFKNEFNSLNYMKPIRAAVNRYYRVQGISVNEVDSDGSNLPMFLQNMKKTQLLSFEKWSKEKFGAVFSIDVSDGGHLSLVIRDDIGSGVFTNVADAGYGYSQMLPIVVLLWNIHNNKNEYIDESQSRSRTIIIEQPELHLHPAFQARMLDVFVNIINECKNNGIELKIIFETHSETMINRIGTLICDESFSANDVNVLVFDKQNGETTIIKTEFDSEGMLKNWPIDFFGVEE